MNKTEIIETFGMQTELELHLLNENCNRRLSALPEDYVFELMLHLSMGTWFNLLHTIISEDTKA